MTDSVCDFEYKWKNDPTKILLLGVDGKKGLGVNATAIKEGVSSIAV